MELRRTHVGPNCTRPFGVDHRVKPGGDEQRVKPGDDESFRSRDAASHPGFAYAKKSQVKKPSQKASPKTPPLKEGRRSADRRVQEPHRKGMRRASFLLPPCGRTEA